MKKITMPTWKLGLSLVMTGAVFYLIGLMFSSHVLVLQGKNSDLRNVEIKLTQDFKQEVDFTRFVEVMSVVRDRYFTGSEDGIDIEAAMDDAVAGFVEGLDDRHSVYMMPDETKAFRDNLNGELQGIGAELRKQDPYVEVVTVIKGAPAAKVGLLPRDIIISVDDEDIADRSFFDTIMEFRGEKGSTVKLGVSRSGKKIYFDIVRDIIKIESVEYELRDDGIAVVEINNFGMITNIEFDKALRELKEKNVKGIVLDLRYNPGGVLNVAVDMVAQFVPEKALIVSRRSNDFEENYTSLRSPLFPDLPVVLLVNKASASASEIFAGTFQDLMRGKIIGETTFGKGSVQEPFEFSDKFLLKLTTSKWYTPLGRNIDHEGIVPDIEIERTQEDFEEDRDPQLEKAIEVVKGVEWRQDEPPELLETGSGAVATE